jgi:hypothetical protein
MTKDYYIFVPREKLRNYQSSNHHNKKGWIKCYYYKEYNKTPIPMDLINENVVDLYRINEVRQDVFYKDHQQSKKNKYFDFYRKLKKEYEGVKDLYIPRPTKIDKRITKSNYVLKPKYQYSFVKTQKPFVLNFD